MRISYVILTEAENSHVCQIDVIFVLVYLTLVVHSVCNTFAAISCHHHHHDRRRNLLILTLFNKFENQTEIIMFIHNFDQGRRYSVNKKKSKNSQM
uniref:CSON004260 protein n=1 Tax=Culicoides sonorensis TaxID=179676 RepID=A0A336MUL5_CULSO